MLSAPIVVRTDDDLDRIYKPTPESAGTRRALNPDAAETPDQALVLLNALPIWDGRIKWAGVQRRGRVLVATTTAGKQVRFDVDKVLRFAHVQARILEHLAIAIRSPRRGQIGETWALAAELLMRAAQGDREDCGAPEDSLRADLARCWRAGGRVDIKDEPGLERHLWLLDRNQIRHPYEPREMVHSPVFVYQAQALVHLPLFRVWASTPGGCNRYFTLPELREGIALLGFQSKRYDFYDPEEQRCRVTVWVGPRNLIEEVE